MKTCKHTRWCDWHGTSGARDVRRCWDCEEKEYRPALQPNGILTVISNGFYAHMMERLAATKGVVINLNG